MSLRHLGPIALSSSLALTAWPAQAQEAPAKAKSAPAAATAPQKDQSAAPHSDWHLLGAVTAYTLAAGATATFTFSYVRGDELNNDEGFQRYKAGSFPGGRPPDNVCVAARNGVVVQGAPSPGYVANICSQSDTLHTLAIVSVVTAVVGIGTGTVLLLTRPSTKEAAVVRAPRLALTPVIGVHSASAQLDYRF